MLDKVVTVLFIYLFLWHYLMLNVEGQIDDEGEETYINLL